MPTTLLLAHPDLKTQRQLCILTITRRVIVRCVIYFQQVNHTFFESKCWPINSFILFFNFFIVILLPYRVTHQFQKLNRVEDSRDFSITTDLPFRVYPKDLEDMKVNNYIIYIMHNFTQLLGHPDGDKGSLVSEGFSLWLKSPKKDTKNLQEKMFRIVIWHLFWEI